MVYIYIRPSPPEQIFTPDKDHSKALGWLDLKEEKPDMVCAKSTKKQTNKQNKTKLHGNLCSDSWATLQTHTLKQHGIYSKIAYPP